MATGDAKSRTRPLYGQVVIGPPGSGKTTYCQAVKLALQRKVVLVNLDPANEHASGPDPDIDIACLITLGDVMESLGLGPNGGLVYCLEYLEANVEWLVERLCQLPEDSYLLFDCPGQVELYTHHTSVRTVIERITKDLDLRLCACHLVDSHYCSEAGKFTSVLLTSLSTMLHLEMPHVNVLSKMDIAPPTILPLHYYTQVLDLSYLLRTSDGPELNSRPYRKLTRAICSVVQDYSLVEFVPLNVQDSTSIEHLMCLVDKANGYLFGAHGESTMRKLMTASLAGPVEDLCYEGPGLEEGF